MAYLKKLSENKYFVRVSRGTGKNREQHSKIVRGNLKAAKKWARDNETKLDLGIPVKTDTHTFQEFYNIWKKQIVKKLSPNTVKSHIWNIERFCLKPLGKMRLDRIKRAHLQAIIDSAAEEKYKRSSIDNLRGALGRLFSDAVKQERLLISPCNHIDLPKNDQIEITVLDEKEAPLFIKECQADRHGIIFEFALETGMRPNEYLALRWADIDWERQTAFIWRGVQWKKGGRYYFKEPKTKGSVRHVELTDSLIKRLKAHKTRQLEERLKAGSSYTKLDLIFPTEIGKPFRLHELNYKHLKPLLRRIGIDKNITLKCLRHTCATLLLMEGENPHSVATRLGHSSILTTLSVYTHYLPTMQKRTTAKLDAILRSA